MNHTHINRYWANKILEWCIDNLGVSKHHKSIPRLVLSNKPSNVFGFFIFETNTITIFIKKHKSFKAFVGTTIHEYTHYLQNLAKYDILDDNNKFEVEAQANEIKFTSICLEYLKSLHYL